jgi:hypothetical protein
VTAQQVLYGISFGRNELIRIDTTTGVGTTIAPLSSSMLPAGLAFRGTTLYTWDNNANRIRELNLATGATVNTIDIGIATFLGEGDLAFRSDGTGFVTGFSPGPLWRFDVTTPSSTLLGNNLPAVMDALAFDASDVLYGLSQSAVLGIGSDPSTRLYTINQATGSATLVGSTGLTNFSTAGLAFDTNGDLYAALGLNGGSPFNGNGASSLYRIDPTTGTATLIGSIGITGVSGLAFGPPPPAGVTVMESAGATNVAEGGAVDTYTVVLTTLPTANVTITLNPGPQLTVAPASLTFTPTNWNVPQTVTVTAVDDAVVEGAQTSTITHTATSTDAGYNGITIAGVTVNITDNDAAPPLPPTGGGEGSYTGSSGPTGSEGSFGFGRHSRRPVLAGPFVQRRGRRLVLNVSHGDPTPAETAEEQRTIPAWSIAATMLLALGAAVVAWRSRSRRAWHGFK